MSDKKLTRSSNRIIAGVCAGLAEYFGLDVTMVRVLYGGLSVATAFSGTLVYLVLWILMPRS